MVNEDNFDDHLQEDEEWISKTEIKRQAQRLQALGERLTKLSASQREKIPMSDALKAAIDECARIKPRSNAMKRHMNYVGKLMRSEEAIEEIQQKVEAFDTGSEAHTAAFHKLERWRDRLIDGNNAELQAFIAEFPEADIQHLRQLIRNAKKEAEKAQSPTSARKLFKYLRELSDLG
ncbi:MAG: ribosome biogenesis factor YjgA [Pontibacterium sp.]